MQTGKATDDSAAWLRDSWSDFSVSDSLLPSIDGIETELS
jgi:hypothetical protein